MHASGKKKAEEIKDDIPIVIIKQKMSHLIRERGNRQDAFSTTFCAEPIAALGWKQDCIDGGDSHSQNI